MPVTVTNGVFNVGIGDTAGNGDALTLDFESNSAYYLQVEVSSNGSTFETLTPRQRLDVASYAVNADTVDGAHAGTSANNVLELGNAGEISISGFISTLSRLILGSSLGAGGGTALLVNTAAPFDGTLLDLQINGSSKVSVASTGLLTATNGLTVSGGSVSFPAGSIADSAIAAALTGKTYNSLSLTSAADGFTIAGGTTSRMLTVSGADVSLNQSLLTSSSPTFTAINAKTIQSTSNDLRISGASGQGITVLTDGVNDVAYIAGDIRDSQNNPYAPETKATVAGAYWFDARYGIRTNAGDSLAKNVYLSGQNQRLNNVTNLSGGDVLIHGGLGASGSAGAAHGGNVKLDGGQGFGTGHAGYVLIGTEQASNVGIGTSDPQEKLHVAGQGTDVALAILSGADTTDGSLKVGELANSLGYLNYDGTDNRWEFGTEYDSVATEAFYIPRGAQSVFFNGTVDVTTTLNVRQALYAGAGTIEGGVSNMINNFQNNTGLLIKPTAAGTGTRVSVVDENGASEFIVQDGGNVGIGTANPTNKLSVAGSISATGLVLGQGVLNGANLVMTATSDGADNESIKIGGGGLPGGPSRGPTLELYGNEVSGFNLYGDAVIRLADGDGATYKGDFRVFGSADLFVVKNDGSVGVGDSTPLSLFTVGNGDLFQVNSSGAIAAVQGITINDVATELTFSSTSPTIAIADTGSLTVSDGTNGLLKIVDEGSSAGINAVTSDGADGTALKLSGGGGSDSTRGGVVAMFGNEFGFLNLNGKVIIDSGDHTNGYIVLRNGGAKTTAYPGTSVENYATSSTASILKSGLQVTSTGTWNGSGASNVGLYVSSVTGGTANYDAIFNGGGNVGIGTTSPGSRLEIENTGSANDVLLLEDSSGLCEAQPTTTGLTWGCSSDESLKTDIAPSSFTALDYLSGIPLFDYTVIKTNERAMGPVAQRLQASHPELVTTGPDGLLTVSTPTTWQLVKGIQELRVMVANLSQSATATVAASFDGLLDWLRDKSISVAGLTVGSSDHPAGVTIFDEDTGDPYCLKIKSGQPLMDSGTCP